MNRDELCPVGVIFAEDEKYVISRYEATDQDLYTKVWNEVFENSPLIHNEEFKSKSW